MGNACELHQILAGGANSRNLEVLPEIALQCVLSVDGALAPIAGSVTYLDLVVFDTEVHRGLRSTLKNDHVPASVLEFRHDQAAHVAVDVSSSQRRLGTPHDFCTGRPQRAR